MPCPIWTGSYWNIRYSGVAPEAIYYRGVSRYKSTNDGSALKWAFETLQAGYKDSEWTMRASVYQAL
jgi:hypothetical protein